MTLTVEHSRIIDAPLSMVWEIVSDLGAYHQHTCTLTETTVISGEGWGATRRCVDTAGNHWEETCTIWEPEKGYVIEVDVSTYPTKYRMLFRSFKGTWNLEAGRQPDTGHHQVRGPATPYTRRGDVGRQARQTERL